MTSVTPFNNNEAVCPHNGDFAVRPTNSGAGANHLTGVIHSYSGVVHPNSGHAVLPTNTTRASGDDERRAIVDEIIRRWGDFENSDHSDGVDVDIWEGDDDTAGMEDAISYFFHDDDEEAEEEEDAALRAERKELVRLMLQSPEMLDDDFGCNLADASDDADQQQDEDMDSTNDDMHEEVSGNLLVVMIFQI